LEISLIYSPVLENNFDSPWRQSWLPAPPDDFRARLRAGSVDPRVIRDLSSYDLDINQLARLTASIRNSHQSLKQTGAFAEFKLGIAASHTVDFIVDALPAAALRRSVLLTCEAAPYGQVAQSVLAANSAFQCCDAVLIALDARALGLDVARLEEKAAREAVDQAIAMTRGLGDAVHANFGARCILATLAASANALFGERDATMVGTPLWMLNEYNRRLFGEGMNGDDLLVDVARMSAAVGLNSWCDARAWHASKLPFALQATPIYCDRVARVIAATVGKNRKCLVLDLDNTLWGGVIGDDGLNGIVLGHGNPVGEAHLALQSYALELHGRGVILAVCSKNNEALARSVFQEHPEMLLKVDHIAAFTANWTDKASNLRAIAAALNIGTDALVFLDDNPAEREQVRGELPEVAVLEVGPEASEYPGAVAQSGWFESFSLSEEDRRRGDYYRMNAARVAAQGEMGNLENYLQSLSMIATIGPFDAANRSRVSQLVNKSNQFNLTTRRYSEADILNFEHSPSHFTLQVRLQDKFGDNGLISIVIFEKKGETWECDTWLMSCRVLGRRVEEAVLDHVADAARKADARKLTGHYRPTKKNALVEKHFEKLGFSEVGGEPDGSTRWELGLDRYIPREAPIATTALGREGDPGRSPSLSSIADAV
jgi:FkbH-like protein